MFGLMAMVAGSGRLADVNGEVDEGKGEVWRKPTNLTNDHERLGLVNGGYGFLDWGEVVDDGWCCWGRGRRGRCYVLHLALMYIL